MSNVRNNKFAAIPEVQDNLQSIATAVRALKQTVDVLTRQTGTEDVWLASLTEVTTKVNTALVEAKTKTDFSKLLNDPTLDDILNRAAERADKLAEKNRNEVRIALAVLQNSIEAYRSGYEEANAVIKYQIDQISTSVDDANASIVTERLARTTATQALTGRIDSVSSTLAGNLAVVTNDVIALSGPTGAIATQINAVTTASTNAKTYIQSTQPRSLASGDYWVDLNASVPVVKQWNGTAWSIIVASIRSTAPTSPAIGDVWYDVTGPFLKIWSGSSWVVQSTAFIQSRTPAVLAVGDLWVDTAQANTLKKWAGASWVTETNVASLGVLLSTLVTESISKTDGDKTSATRFDNLVSVGPDGNTATISGTQLTTATRTEALASDLTSLEVQTTGGSAGGFYRLLASSSPSDGAAAEFQVQVRAAESGPNSTFATAGMRIQAFSNGTSRVKFNTDQFIVTTPSGTQTPFAITNGQLAVNAALAATNITGSLPNTQVSGLGALATKSTVSATSDVTGLGNFAVLNKISQSNVATYIELAAISGAYIRDLDAGTITTGSLSANRISGGTITGVNLNITRSNGQYVLQAFSGNDNVFLWQPIASVLTAGNIANSSAPAVAATANFVEALSAYGAQGSAYNHGVRGGCAAGTSGLVGVANGYDFYAEGGGINYGPFTGAHDALVDIGYEVELGEIVVDVECLVRRGISNVLCRVEKSSRPNQKGAVGVVAYKTGQLGDTVPPAVFDQNPFPQTQADIDPSVTWPIILTEERYIENEMTPIWDAMRGNYDQIAINALGEGQVLVCGQGGNLEVGDLITTSFMPGKGMKQGDDTIRSYTVAKARENVTFSSPDEVKLVACIYLCG